MPTSSPGTGIEPPVDGDDCFHCQFTGSPVVQGYVTRKSTGTQTGVYANKTITIVVKKCEAPSLKAHPRNNYHSPPHTYCSNGHLEVFQTTTDCTGFYQFSFSTVSYLAFAVFFGDYIKNPDYDCALYDSYNPATFWLIPNPASAWDYACCQHNWHSEGAIGSTPGSWDGALQGNVVDGSFQINPSYFGSFGLAKGNVSDRSFYFGDISGGASNYICFAPTGQNEGGPIECCENAGGTAFTPFDYTAVFASYEQYKDIRDGSGILECYVPYVLNGTMTLNINVPSWPYLRVYKPKDGKFYAISGVNLTVTDSCGHSQTVVSGGALTNLDWTLINGYTINSGSPVGCDPAGWSLSGSALTSLGSLPRITPTSIPDWHLYCPCSNQVIALVLSSDCEGAAGITVNADTYHERFLSLVWINSAGALKVATHNSPQGFIGNGADGWNAVHNVESANAADIGLAYLENGRLYLTYALSGTPKFRTANKVTPAQASDWSATATPDPSVARHSDQGRGQGQAFRARSLAAGANAYSGSGNIEFSQCRQNTGEHWTAPVSAVAGARGLYCGCVFISDGYGLLYKRDSDAGVYFKTTQNPSIWGAGQGTLISALSWQPVGLVRLPSGRLVALLWDGGSSNLCKAAYSNDRGVTWTQSGTIAALPAMTTPPALVNCGHTVFAVFATGDTPRFVGSLDGGQTWA